MTTYKLEFYVKDELWDQQIFKLHFSLQQYGEMLEMSHHEFAETMANVFGFTYDSKKESHQLILAEFDPTPRKVTEQEIRTFRHGVKNG